MKAGCQQSQVDEGLKARRNTVHHTRPLITLHHRELFYLTLRKGFFAGIDPNIGLLSSVKSYQNQDPFEGKAKSKKGERGKGYGS